MLSTIAALVVPRKSIWTLRQRKQRQVRKVVVGLAKRAWWLRATLRDRQHVLSRSEHPHVRHDRDEQCHAVQKSRPAAEAIPVEEDAQKPIQGLLGRAVRVSASGSGGHRTGRLLVGVVGGGGGGGGCHTASGAQNSRGRQG